MCLRGVFPEKFVDLIRRGIAYNRDHPSANTKRKANHSPLFFSDYDNWKHVREFEEFIFQSPAASIASTLLNSQVKQKSIRVTWNTDAKACGLHPEGGVLNWNLGRGQGAKICEDDPV